MIDPSTDPLAHVRAYAPPAPSRVRDDKLLKRVFAAEDSRPPVRTGHRRAIVAGGAAAVVILGAGTAAAAVGPDNMWNAVFGPTAPSGSEYQADPSTARKVFVAPGPDGQEFAAWTVSNDVGWRCIDTFFEPAGTSTPPPALLHSGGDCKLASPPDTGLFASVEDGYTPQATDRLRFVSESGDAARAELRVSTGVTYPLVVRDGWLGGWFTREQVPLGSDATVVAFGSDGDQLGSFPAIDQSACESAGGC